MLAEMLDSLLSHSGVMEVLDENGAHCDHFLRAANRSDNSWRRRQKTSESGSHQGSRLL
jgi:hypothetical protein